MNVEQNKDKLDTLESRLFVIGFIKDTSEPYYDLAERLSKPAAYFRNDELWKKYHEANALGDYWQIIRYVIEKAIEQRKIFISNVPINIIEDRKNSHKITLAEARLIGFPNCKYMHYTKQNYEIFVPKELEFTHKSYLPNELL
jgi:hypothetical protein